MKVGREEMIGVSPLEQSGSLFRELKKIPGLDLGYTPDLKSHRVQRVLVEWDERKMGLGALRHDTQGMTFVFVLGEPGDEKLVVRAG